MKTRSNRRVWKGVGCRPNAHKKEKKTVLANIKVQYGSQ